MEDEKAEGSAHPPCEVFNAANVFKYIAKEAYEKRWYEAAIKLFNIAECLTVDDQDKVPLCLYKSLAHKAMIDIDATRYEAMKAMAYNGTENLTPYLQMAYVLYNENEYEECTRKFVKGNKSMNPAFQDGLNIVLGTLDNCVGENAGTMFEKDVLGGTVQKMKQEQIGFAAPPKQLSHIQRAARDAKLRMRKRFIAGRYLGKIAKDKDFFDYLKDCPEIKYGSPRVVKQLQDVIDSTTLKLDLKLDTLWHRKPLYTYYNKVKNFQASNYAKEFTEHIKSVDNESLNQSVSTKVQELISLKDRSEYTNCYMLTLRLREKLRYLSEEDLANRNQYMNIICKVMGETYLDSKRLLPNRSEEFNDLRIKFAIGVNRQYWPTLIEEVLHVYVVNPKHLTHTYLNELEITTDPYEKVFLNHEIATLNANNSKVMRKHCSVAIAYAKSTESLVWFLNCLFILARSSFIDKQYDEGRLTLVAIKELCLKHGYAEQAKFISRALLLLQHLKPADFIQTENVFDKERNLYNSMVSEHLKNKLVDFMNSLNSLPEWGQAAVPGIVTLKQKMAAMRKIRPKPIEKINALDQILHRENWVGGLEDQEPYTIKDKMNAEQEQQLINQVHNDPVFAQLLNLQEEVNDHEE